MYEDIADNLNKTLYYVSKGHITGFVVKGLELVTDIDCSDSAYYVSADGNKYNPEKCTDSFSDAKILAIRYFNKVLVNLEKYEAVHDRACDMSYNQHFKV